MLYAVSPPDTKILKVERRGDGLWLSSEFGIHRLSPKNARCIRVSFTREEDFSVNPRPGVLEREDYKDWDFEVTDEEIVLRTEEITLKINRNTASYRWFDKNGKLLLQEAEKDSRSLEKFDVLKTTSAKTEKVLTADGEKEVIKESSSEVAGHCWIKDGTIMLPLAFDYPDDAIANKITDQYMFGDSLMVCPVTEPMYYLPGSKKMEAKKTRKVYLPKGGWYDYYTNVYYKGGKYITADAPIDKIPLFVREGSVIPVSKPAGSTEELSGEIKLRVYAGHDAVYYLYEDAFDGYGYERGEYRITRIRWHEREHKIDVESETPDQNAENNGKYRYQIVQEDTEVFCQGCI